MTDLTPLDQVSDLTALERRLESKTTRAVADELTRLDSPAAMAIPFRLLDRERALAVFEMLDPYHQQQVLEGLRDDRFHQLIEGMDPDDRARLVGELPAKVANRVLTGLSPEAREATAALLGYPEKSAGRLMTPEYVNLRESMTVEQALEKVRRQGEDAETVYLLPVTDDERHLRGVISLRRLVLSSPQALVGALMTHDVHAVRVTDQREAAARLMQEAGLLVLPVLDSEGRLVGIITVDDAMEVLQEEETEDRALSGATKPLDRPYTAATVFDLARSRALWLLILIAAAALTINVLQYFEDTLAAVVTLTLFIPLLIDTGGNSGSQASTVVTRAIAVGEVRMGDLPRVLWREGRVGLLLGVMLGAVAFVPMYFLFDHQIAIIIGLTLVAICTWATFAGSMLPLLAHRMGVDPAVVSAPLITTLVDSTGLIIYFLIARSVLGI